MSSSKKLFYFCLSIILGIFASLIIKIPHIFLWGILILGVSFVLTYFLPKRFEKINFAIIGFCLLFFALGISRGQVSLLKIEGDLVRKLNDREDVVVLTGVVTEEPDIRQNHQNLRVKIDKTKSIVLVSANSRPIVSYLDKVRITGKLKTPEVFDGFNYKNYLIKEKIYSVMDFPKVEVISKDHEYNIFSYLYEKILFIKDKFSKSINSRFEGESGALVKGIILGDNKSMSQETKDKFSSAGLSHLTAISGLNIVILSSILMSLMLFLGFWRQQSLYLSFVILWFYTALVGFPASGVRAAIMASILLFAEFFGRQNTSSRTVVLSATVMLLLNPFLLIYDVGFQLSFLAVVGLIYLEPIFTKIIKSRVVAGTLAAQIFTLPIMIYNFGNISFVSPITNLLISPIVSFLMVLGFLTSFAGVFSNFLGYILTLSRR